MCVSQVEKIVGERVEGGVHQYLLRWREYGAADDSWEPAAEVDAPEAVCEFTGGLRRSARRAPGATDWALGVKLAARRKGCAGIFPIHATARCGTPSPSTPGQDAPDPVRTRPCPFQIGTERCGCCRRVRGLRHPVVDLSTSRLSTTEGPCPSHWPGAPYTGALDSCLTAAEVFPASSCFCALVCSHPSPPCKTLKCTALCVLYCHALVMTYCPLLQVCSEDVELSAGCAYPDNPCQFPGTPHPLHPIGPDA